MTRLNENETANDHKRSNKLLRSCAIFFIFLLFSLTVFAEYSQRGYDNTKTYQDSDTVGFFNSQITTDFGYVRTLTNNNLVQPPLIVDYDEDGVNEIIVSDDDAIRIYEDKTLQLVESFPTNATIETYSVFEYDSEFYLLMQENIGATLYDTVIVYKYNGSEWLYNAHKNSNTNNCQKSIFQCYEENGLCITLCSKGDGINAQSFNISGTETSINGIQVKTWTTPNNLLCLSSIADITAYNKDNDNFYEFYMSEAEINTIGGNSLDIGTHEIRLNQSGHIISTTTIKTISPDFNDGATCDDYEYYFTSPLITDVDLINPLDVVIGVNTDEDEFKMYSFKLDGSTIDDYPELFEADGIIISNPVQANVFEAYTNLENKDFCVLGYTEGNGTDLLCASEQLVEIFGLGDSIEFKSSNASNSFSLDSDTNQNIIHATQHSSETVDGTNPDEFLTPFGIYKLNFNGNLFEKIYGFSYTNGILSDGDVENTGRKDLLYVTENSIIYIDDGFSNSNALIDDYCINPCIDSTWQKNSTVSITITPTDIDGDDVQAKAILYYGHYDENVTQDSNWSILVNSGTSLQFTFTADTVISNSVLRLQARDSEHNDTEGDIIDITFAVNNNGVVFGDCETCVSGLSVPVVDNTTAVAPVITNPYTNEDNLLKSTIDNMALQAGVPTIILLLEFILIMDVFVLALAYFYGKGHNMGTVLTGLGIVDLFALIIPSLMGIISRLFMYGIIMALFAFLAFYFSRLYNKGAGGN